NGAVAAALAPPAARSSVSSTTRPTMQQAAEDIAVDSDSESDEGDEHQDTVNVSPVLPHSFQLTISPMICRVRLEEKKLWYIHLEKGPLKLLRLQRMLPSLP